MILIQNKSLRSFALEVFKFLYKYDQFNAFWNNPSKPGWARKKLKNGSEVIRVVVKNKNISLSGLFKDNRPNKQHYLSHPFHKDGVDWYLRGDWREKQKDLFYENLQRFIEYFYPQYNVGIFNEYYTLYDAQSSASTASSEEGNNIPENNEEKSSPENERNNEEETNASSEGVDSSTGSLTFPKPFEKEEPRQVIFFGAPGTGKSYAVTEKIKEFYTDPKQQSEHTLRTTFHPDSDYSSFVGCFKPSMNGSQVVYAFTPQVFAKAYVRAWRDCTQPFFLVIEEINRGNCAQIFGDIFQLLDRDVNGESQYEIEPDADLKNYIKTEFSKNRITIKCADVKYDEVENGNVMRLPRNLFIYATMNTSDQSLFPIDSAFKRRWDWKYFPITSGNPDHTIAVGGVNYSWNSFIKNVNAKIYEITKSEDKQLGFWFIKPQNGTEINWKDFVSKVIFYLWSDVMKDYASMEPEDSPFGKNFAFSTFFDENGDPKSDQVINFLNTLDVLKI